MHPVPPLPDVREVADGDILDGHLWLLELVDGTRLRFRMHDSGLLRFGDAETTYDGPEAVPLPLRPAVRWIRERFDREALRDAVPAADRVGFLGVATHHRGIDYDWDRLPPFLGTDVWVDSGTDPADGAFRPPDAAAAIFEGIGLEPITAVAREVNARDFDPDGYTVPASAWRDGSAAGVVVRNKRGGRATLAASEPSGRVDAPDRSDPDAVAAAHATEERVERVIAELSRQGATPAVDAVVERVVEAIARETPVRFGSGNASVGSDQLRASVRDRVRPVLDGRAASGDSPNGR
jgi:hypothetical protein